MRAAEPQPRDTDRGLGPAVERRIWAARAALLWEMLWPGVAPALGVAGLFVIVALFDLWAFVPPLLHGLGLLLFGIALAAAAWWGLARVRLPGRAAGRRRLEARSQLAHRPLTALEDQLSPSISDPGAHALWRIHRRRVLAKLGRLTIGLPEAGLSRRDVWGLRAAVVLLLIIAFAVAGPDAPQRLRIAFEPGAAGSALVPPSVDAWVNPPAYTQLPPMFLTRDGQALLHDKPVAIPAGSALLARVHGGRGKASLVIDREEHAFETVDALNRQFSTTLERGARLAIRQGDRTLAEWPIDVVPDRAPEIAFAAPPKPSNRGALEIRYSARDDYGLKRVVAEVRRDGAPEVLTLELPLPAVRAKSAGETGFHDLTPHPWAGLTVKLRLVATDLVDQTGSSETVEVTLPEREFQHPVARAVIEQRKLLTLEPGRRRTVALVLNALMATPELYDSDVVAHLGLSVARAKLLHDRSATAIASVQELLWDTALRIEDGNLSVAERDLRQAQRELMEALARDAPDEEIERLMDQLRQAMDRFLQALAEQAQRRAERGEEIPEFDPNTMRMLDSRDLQRMLERARELMQSGARDAARQMLSELQRMLESLRDGRMARMPPGMQQGGQAMQELNELMRRQQELLDRSFRRSQPGQQGRPAPGQRGQQGQQGRQGQPGGDDAADAAEQEALRRQLGEMMRRLGEAFGDIPGAFGRAERSMGEARDALGAGEPGDAVGPQTDALDQLRQGAQSMMQQMMDQLGRMGDMFGLPPGQDRVGRAQVDREDPLGRPYQGQWDEGLTTKVPDEFDLQRARDILEELQRRSGDRRRPELERDYIDRLLRRF